MAASPKEVLPAIAPPIETYAEFLTEEEARVAFDRVARRRMGLSGEAFLRRWDAGEFRDDPDRPGLMETVLALPFVGR